MHSFFGLAFAQEDNGMMGEDTGMMGNDTMSMGNDTSMMMNATLAYAQEAVSIPPNSALQSPELDEKGYYQPKILGEDTPIPPGTPVTWTNDDSTIHTVTEGKLGNDTPKFDSSIMGPQQTFEYTFDQPGEYDYYCQMHPFMVGQVIVG